MWLRLHLPAKRAAGSRRRHRRQLLAWVLVSALTIVGVMLAHRYA
jgi:predicted nucleic acid-binding Zn ribbon protein